MNYTNGFNGKHKYDLVPEIKLEVDDIIYYDNEGYMQIKQSFIDWCNK